MFVCTFGNFHDYDRYKGIEELMPFAKGVSAKSHDFDADGNETHTDYRKALQRNRFYWEKADSFPVIELDNALDEVLFSMSVKDKATVMTTLEASGLMKVLDDYREGNHSGAVSVLSQLIRKYLDIEEISPRSDN